MIIPQNEYKYRHMGFQLSEDINIEYTDGGIDPSALLVTLNIENKVDEALLPRAKKIFRSRKYNWRRPVEARIYAKPGRPRKIV